MEIPETRYSRSEDGVHIAYQVLGDADLDLVVSPGFVSHLEHSWEDPALARFLRRLASFSRLIVFDKRGTGMSDRSVDDEHAPLLEDRVNDIATLMDTVGSEQAAMMGLSETGAVALLFAATYPERTRAVVAYGAFAGGGDTGPTYPWAPDPRTAERLKEIERNWGRGVLFLDEFAGSLRDDTHYREWFAKLERMSASPGAAVALARTTIQWTCATSSPRSACRRSSCTSATTRRFRSREYIATTSPQSSAPRHHCHIPSLRIQFLTMRTAPPA